MATFGWVLLAVAFLVLMMVANNSWTAVWSKISGSLPTGTASPAQSGETTASGQPVVTGPNPTPDNPTSFPDTPEVTPQNPGRILIQNPNDPNGPPLEIYG